MSDRLLIATRKGLFDVVRGPSGWRIVSVWFLGDAVSIVLPDRRDGRLYAAIGHGHFGVKLHRSDDGGKSWAEVAAPAYPPPLEGVEPFICPFRKTPIPNSLELIWALEPGGERESGVLWCGTVPGGLFRSRDRGQSWEIMASLWHNEARREWAGGGLDWPGIHSVCVDPRDPRRVSVGISCGGVWQTTDGGATWQCRATGMRAAYTPPETAYHPNIQDPHCVVQCRANPDVMWAQHHNGIFRTTDGSASWHEIENVPLSAFGFAVAVHPRHADTAWFVPAIKDERRVAVDARVAVTRTRDGGRSFEVLTRGLPQEHAYDLVFRHALAIDESGDRLAFGSTTGSLWISEDQGDHWTELSAHLPPIQCVRFA